MFAKITNKAKQIVKYKIVRMYTINKTLSNVMMKSMQTFSLEHVFEQKFGIQSKI